MNIRFVLFIQSVILFWSCHAFAGELPAADDSNTNAVYKPKVGVVQIQDVSDKKKFPQSSVYWKIISRSFSDFIYPLSFIEATNLGKLSNIQPAALALTNDLDAVIIATYSLGGKKNNLRISVNLTVWSADRKKAVLQKTYTGYTDRRIFDAVDSILSDSALSLQKLLSAKKQALPAPKLATLLLTNFITGEEKYNFYLNNSLFEVISNTGYSADISVLAGMEYSVLLKRQEDGKEVFKKTFVPKPDEAFEIGYQALGVVKFYPLQNREQWKTYRYLFDDKPVPEDALISNVPAGQSHTLIVEDNFSNVAATGAFYLRDKELEELHPSLPWVGGFHLKIYKTDETYAGIGLDVFITRYLWAGGGCGFWSAYDSISVKNYMMLYPYAEVGYYFLGDMTRNIRLGAGLIGQTYSISPGAPPADSTVLHTVYMGVGGFVLGEYLIFFIRPACYYDLQGGVRFQLAFGVKF